MPASNRGLALSNILVQKFVTAAMKACRVTTAGAWDMKDALHEFDTLIEGVPACPAAG